MPRRRNVHRSSPAAPDRTASRREFLRALGAASALPLVGALPLAAQPPAPPAPLPAAATPEAVEAADAADARSLAEIVQRRFGARFDEAQLYEIRKDIEGSLAAGRVLRAAALQNGDEPAVVFRALDPEA